MLRITLFILVLILFLLFKNKIEGYIYLDNLVGQVGEVARLLVVVEVAEVGEVAEEVGV